MLCLLMIRIIEDNIEFDLSSIGMKGIVIDPSYPALTSVKTDMPFRLDLIRVAPFVTSVMITRLASVQANHPS